VLGSASSVVRAVSGYGSVQRMVAGNRAMSAAERTERAQTGQPRADGAGAAGRAGGVGTPPRLSPAYFDDLARQATKNPDSRRLVLGHFDRQGTSYQKVAAHYDATYFKLDDYNSITKGLSQDEIWRINETFLTQQLRQGKQVLFSHDPLKARQGSFFEREVRFMGELGYKFQRKNQWTWEAVR
jgi:hypothetical protein